MKPGMKRTALWFTAPFQVETRQEEVDPPRPGEARVDSLVSAISPGSEMLFYRGEFPEDIPLDAGLAALKGRAAYPLKYGYSLVGRVSGLGSGDSADWMGRLVFAFQPHHSQFNAPLESLMPLPEGFSAEQAVFLPNMETAINFVQDGAPLIGEQVVVFGQGIVGLLTTALLSQFPLASLLTLDRYPLRRQAALQCGATACFDPAEVGSLERLHACLPDGADLVYELSGSPAALDQAIAVTGFSGRVVIGSWYGQKRLSLNLGGAFHRSRIRLLSSQVSTLAPELSGRWSKQRRFDLAWEMLRIINPVRFVTHRFPMEQAAEAYRLVIDSPQDTIQVLIDYA